MAIAGPGPLPRSGPAFGERLGLAVGTPGGTTIRVGVGEGTAVGPPLGAGDAETLGPVVAVGGTVVGGTVVGGTVGRGVGVGVGGTVVGTGPCTVIVPFIVGWIEQW